MEKPTPRRLTIKNFTTKNFNAMTSAEREVYFDLFSRWAPILGLKWADPHPPDEPLFGDYAFLTRGLMELCGAFEAVGQEAFFASQVPGSEPTSFEELIKRLDYDPLLQRTLRDEITQEVEESSGHFAMTFIHHRDFPAYFQEEIGTVPAWHVKPLLREYYGPQSARKLNQLDGWEDYEYLADILRVSLTDTAYQNEGFSKESLQIGVDWLLETARQLRPEELQPAKAEPLPVEGLKWQGSKAELAELGYSLLEAGLLKVKEGERGAALTALGRFFGMDLGKPESHLQTIQKRKDGVSPTPLLDRLRTAFVAFLKR